MAGVDGGGKKKKHAGKAAAKSQGKPKSKKSKASKKSKKSRK